MRYNTKTDEDLVKEVQDLMDRVSKLERTPRMTATAIDRGSLIVNIEGTITINGTNGEIIQFNYYALIDSTILASVPNVVTSTSDVDMQVNDITFDTVNQTFFNYFTLDRVAFSIWGGLVQLAQTFVTLSYVNNAVQTSYFALREFSIFGVTGNLWIQGRWLDNQQLSTIEALNSGALNVSAGVSSATVTYAQSYATTMYAIPTLHSASGAVNWSVTAQSASSFTTSWIGTTAKIVNFWNIRM